MTDENTIHPEEPLAAVSTPHEDSAESAEPHHDAAAPHVITDAGEHEPPDAHPESPAAGQPADERHDDHEAPKAPAKKTRKSKVAAVAADEVSAPPLETDAPAASLADGTAAAGTPTAPESNKKWYVVKIQSGREDSIKAAIERKVKIEGLEEFFGQIAIPVEEIVQKKTVKVTDKKTGEKVTQEKKVIKYQKKFPGYLFAEVEFNDRILYLFRETSGVGDFVGASLKRDPTPMTDREVRGMLTGVVDGDPNKPNQKQKVKLDYEKGDKVKIRDGAFANMEGIVKSITETKDTGETPKVKVEVTIFGRPVEVDLDYWHVDKT